MYKLVLLTYLYMYDGLLKNQQMKLVTKFSWIFHCSILVLTIYLSGLKTKSWIASDSLNCIKITFLYRSHLKTEPSDMGGKCRRLSETLCFNFNLQPTFYNLRIEINKNLRIIHKREKERIFCVGLLHLSKLY